MKRTRPRGTALDDVLCPSIATHPMLLLLWYRWSNAVPDLRVIVFFFSSRRRHTRLTCDWSSDVCSSDLSGEDSAPGWGGCGSIGFENHNLPIQERCLHRKLIKLLSQRLHTMGPVEPGAR